MSENGTLAYATGQIRGSGRELLRFVKVDAGGHTAPLALDPQELYRRFVLSPFGELAAAPGWDGGVWVYDLARGSKRKLAGAQNAESAALPSRSLSRARSRTTSRFRQTARSLPTPRATPAARRST